MTGYSTHPSLLQRLRQSRAQDAWREFDAQYGELVVGYCRSRGLQPADAEDVRQITMLNLSKALRSFEYDPVKGRFRGYLRRVVHSAIQRHLRDKKTRELPADESLLAAVAPPQEPTEDRLWELAWVRHHYRLAMRALRTTCDERTIAIFDRFIAGATVRSVAELFGMTEDAVRKVRTRVKEKLQKLIEQQVSQEEQLIGNEPA